MKMRPAATVGLLVLTASLAVAAEGWRDELRAAIEFQAEEWNKGYQADGLSYRLVPADLPEEKAPFLYEIVGSDEPWEASIVLEQAREYVIMAVCDRDCYDIDLYASREGEPVDEDTEDDAVPVVEFTSSGRETLHVEMIDCGADLCYVALGVFAKVQ